MPADFRTVLDEILGELASDRVYRAANRYRAATGVPIREAGEEVAGLHEALHDDSDEADERAREFEQRLRERMEDLSRSLSPERRPTGAADRTPSSPPRRSRRRPVPDRPAPAPSTTDSGPTRAATTTDEGLVRRLLGTGVSLVCAHVLLTLTGLGIVGAGLLASRVFGALGSIGVASIVALPMIFVFATLLNRTLGRTRWRGALDRMFGYAIVIGIAHLYVAFLGVEIADRLLWLERTEVRESDSEERLRAAAHSGDLLRAPGARAGAPWGHTTVRRSTNSGGSRQTRTERYTVARLRFGEEDTAMPETPGCVWVGESTSTLDRLAHSLLPIANDSPYLRPVRFSRSTFLEAVEDALGGPPPTCTVVLRRLPPPDILRQQIHSRAKLFVAGLHGIPLLLLAGFHLVRGARRLGTWWTSRAGR